MKKLSVIVLALVMVMAMVVTAHAAPNVEGTWVVNTATYTEAGAEYMNEYFPVEGYPWVAGFPYPAAAGAAYIFTATQFSSTVPANTSEYTWTGDSTFVAGDATWTVSIDGDTMVLTEGALGTAYVCTRVAGGGGSGGESGGETGGDSGSSNPDVPNTADPFSLGLFTTMAAASLGGIVVLKKKSRG